MREQTEKIPDLNVFMMCRQVREEAFAELPSGYHFRSCREDEVDWLKRAPFDDPVEAVEYENFMNEWFETVYAGQLDQFRAQTILVCGTDDRPVATCSWWKAYGQINTIHWLKTLPEFEGKGLGRALLSEIFRRIPEEGLPVYLHTQPGSYRAIKLYSDFGFQLLTNPVIGNRTNDLQATMRWLEKYMRPRDFQNLKTCLMPTEIQDELAKYKTIEF